MKGISIDWEEGCVKHAGFYIELRFVKEWILKNTDIANDYVIFKTFNSKTGEIDRKYAWDTILFLVNKDIGLKNVFNEILQNEGLNG
jgi:hypothetical protein